MEQTISLEQPEKVSIKSSLRSNLKEIWKQREIQLMVFPWIIYIIIFSYLPMYGIVMAFQNYSLGDIPGFSSWAGLSHFQAFFNSPDFFKIMKNTVGISLLKLLFCFPLPIVLAICLNEITRNGFKRVVQTISYLPHFISWVVVAGLTFDMLSVDGGIVNYFLLKLGVVSEPVLFLGEPGMFWPILIITDLWKEIGWSSIIFIATISSIDPQLYEASSIDGAGRLRKIWHVTISGIKPTIVILLILSVSNILNAGFEQILLMTNNLRNTMVSDVSEIIDTYVYRVGIAQMRYSYATAAGVFKAIISVLLLFFANKFAKKMTDESLW